jgi:hypothetical protein
MESDLALAFASQPHRVLGRSLRPYTLRHQFALLALGSPFESFKPGETIGWPELESAVTVCTLDDPMPELYRLARHRTFGMAWRATFKRDTLRAECERFAAYLTEHCSVPELFSAPSDGKAPSTPAQLRILCRLLAAGMPLADVWRLTPGQAQWLLVGLSEIEGGNVSIVTDEMREMVRLAETGALN